MVWFVVLFLSVIGNTFADELRDIKPPVFFPRNYLFLIIILVLIILAGLVVLIRYFLKRLKKKEVTVSQLPRPAHELAYEALEALKFKDLPSKGKIKEYYIELSDIARHYIENRFEIRAPEMTTEEFLFSLKDSVDLTGAHKNLLKEFLSHCDMVKFAKYGPSSQEMNDSFAAAKRLVDETKIENSVIQEKVAV